MNWFYLMLGSSFLVSITSLLEKKALIKEHAVEYSSVTSILTTLFSIPLLFFINYDRLPLNPFIFLFFISMMSATAFVLIAKSIRHMEVSSVSPMLNMSIGITALFSFLILKEHLSMFQIAGIIMLIIGSYILQTHKEESIFAPIKTFIRSKYLHFVLLAVLIYGIDSVYDRYALLKYDIDPIAYLLGAHIFISIHLLALMAKYYDGLKGIRRGLKSIHWWAVAISVITVIQRLMNVFAIQMANIGLVVAVKRSSSFFTVLLAGELFHEKNILRKMFASAILIGGVILVAIK